LIRPEVWNDERVDVWYRQNIFLLFYESVKPNFPEFDGDNLIHPDFWKEVVRLRQQVAAWNSGETGIENSSKALKRAVAKKIQKFM
jgi:hypothetical protein